MIRYPGRPTDAELQAFANPAAIQGTHTFDLIEDGGRLVARPVVVPAWAIWVGMLIPPVGTAVLLACVPPYGSFAFWEVAVLAAVGVLVVGQALHALFALLNEAERQRGDWFALDRANRTLELPRVGRVVRPGDAVELVVLHRWYHYSAPWESGADYVREVSVLVRADDGGLERVPVLVCAAARYFGRARPWPTRSGCRGGR